MQKSISRIWIWIFHTLLYFWITWWWCISRRGESVILHNLRTLNHELWRIPSRRASILRICSLYFNWKCLLNCCLMCCWVKCLLDIFVAKVKSSICTCRRVTQLKLMLLDWYRIRLFNYFFAWWLRRLCLIVLGRSNIMIYLVRR